MKKKLEGLGVLRVSGEATLRHNGVVAFEEKGGNSTTYSIVFPSSGPDSYFRRVDLVVPITRLPCTGATTACQQHGKYTKCLQSENCAAQGSCC